MRHGFKPVLPGCLRLVLAMSGYLLLLSLVVANTSGIPEVEFSIYGAVQENAPVQVVGFHYSFGEISVDLRNDSEKTVSSVQWIPGSLPLNCAGEYGPGSGVGTPPGKILIRPNKVATLSGTGTPFTPSSLVMGARDHKRTHIFAQVGVYKVQFTDGSIWEGRVQDRRPEFLFDQSPVETPSDACADSDTALHALSAVTRVRFQGRTPAPMAPIVKTKGVTVPTLFFSCALAREVATCPDAVFARSQKEN